MFLEKELFEVIFHSFTVDTTIFDEIYSAILFCLASEVKKSILFENPMVLKYPI